uniref:T-box domain-containing protein n=1 Tax=Hippocampus comes TaxID=109280 RepID=A0A3Q2YGS1_HIPCM
CNCRAPSKPPRGAILTPESTCRGIQVTLDNNNMWNEFFRCKTEMILTKQGSRMFPYCRFRISGLQPSEKYVLMMDIQLVDQSRYTWTGSSWQMAGKAEHHVTNSPFTHPESPATGHHWMQNPVSFYKLKLTGNAADQEGNVILHPMHRYIPRFHVVQTDKAAKDIKLNASNVATFTFQQTEFMAVTAYQNCQFAQLKVDCNPFAKGLREDGVGSRGLKLKSNQDGAAATGPQQAPKKSLKSLLANHKARTCLDTKSSGVTCVQEASPGSLLPASFTGVPLVAFRNSSQRSIPLSCPDPFRFPNCRSSQFSRERTASAFPGRTVSPRTAVDPVTNVFLFGRWRSVPDAFHCGLSALFFDGGASRNGSGVSEYRFADPSLSG